MTQKDYMNCKYMPQIRRHSARRKVYYCNKIINITFTLIAVLLIIFTSTHYIIVYNNPKNTPLPPILKRNSNNNLPPKPEERWQYIEVLKHYYTIA